MTHLKLMHRQAATDRSGSTRHRDKDDYMAGLTRFDQSRNKVPIQ